MPSRLAQGYQRGPLQFQVNSFPYIRKGSPDIVAAADSKHKNVRLIQAIEPSRLESSLVQNRSKLGKSSLTVQKPTAISSAIFTKVESTYIYSVMLKKNLEAGELCKHDGEFDGKPDAKTGIFTDTWVCKDNR